MADVNLNWSMGVLSDDHVYRVVRDCLVAYLASWVIALTAAHDFAPIPSCTNDLSSFAGIVCSGDAKTGNVVHCVFNEHFQAGQVCSAWQWISKGHCPRYLKQQSGIDEFACIGYDLCPRETFRSYEVYKYPACLNKSLYINESTTTQSNTTEQPSSMDCTDRNSTGQPMPCAVPVVITVIVLMTVFCLLGVWEYRSGKSLLGVIFKRLKNCRHSTTDTQQVPQGEAELSAEGQLMSVQGSEVGPDHQHQQV